MAPRVLISDKLSPAAVQIFADRGVDTVVKPGLDKDQLAELENHEQIILRYVNDQDQQTEDSNPNGSIDNIAGISNREGNVMGLMPHPERASIPELSPNGQATGRLIFDSMISKLKESNKKTVYA